jgi:hypothetical protein
MSEASLEGSPRDPERIDVNDESECLHWCKELHVSAGELKAAVHYAGNRTADVRKYLDERRSHAETAPPPSMRK